MLEVFCLVHLPHASLAEEAFDPIRPEFLTRCQGNPSHATGTDQRERRRRTKVTTDYCAALTRSAGRSGNSRRAQEASGAGLLCEERLDLQPQGVIARARFDEKGRALLHAPLERRVIE